MLGVADADFPPLKRTVSDFEQSLSLFFGFSKDNDLAAVVEIEKLGNAIDICSLVVDPGFFRQGIAQQLLQFVEDYDDSEMLVVETGEANLPAIALYERFGFEKQKQWVTSNGISKISLRKPKP